MSDVDMLDILRQLLARHGYLSGLVIDETDNSPSSSTYRSRFGSLLRTYSLMGYKPDRDYGYVDENAHAPLPLGSPTLTAAMTALARAAAAS